MGFQLSHDGGHFAVSSNPTINYLCTLTSFPYIYNTIEWYLEHDVSHHIQTAKKEDEDTNMLDPIGRSTKDYIWKKHYICNVFVSLIFYILFVSIALTILVPLNLLMNNSTYSSIKNKYLFIDKYKYSLCLQVLGSILISLYPIYWYPNWYGLMYAIVTRIISNIYFILVTQVSHNQEECQVEKSDVNYTWCQQQVMHSVDYNVYSIFWNVITGGLNAQGLHHCLPYVHHCHYPYMYDEYVNICNKHNIKPHIRPGYLSALLGFIKQMHNLSYEDYGQ